MSPDLFAFVVFPAIALMIALGGFGIVVRMTRRKSGGYDNPSFARTTWQSPRPQPTNSQFVE